MELSGNTMQIPLLSRDNYDTWRLRIQAVMTKNKTWPYASRRNTKPEPTAENALAIAAWHEEDDRAKADLYPAINDAELKQVKKCETTRDIWQKLEWIFESKGPAKKASLWKRLMTHRLKVSGNIRTHIDEFFNIVNKLSELNIEISNELQSIMLLHSLPESFDNFRYAIESRYNLPDPEALKVKILDEDTTRTERIQNDEYNAALLARKTQQVLKKRRVNKAETKPTDGTFKYKCHKCRKIGHKAAECPDKKENARVAEDESFLALKPEEVSCRSSCDARNVRWCLDSGCMSHLCNDRGRFTQFSDTGNTKLNLANCTSAEIKGKGTVRLETLVGDTGRGILLENTMHVPDLRSNLMSVARITDTDCIVTFDKDHAEVRKRGSRDIILIADRFGDLYYIRESPEQQAHASSTVVGKSKLQIWNERLGHLNKSDLLEMHKKRLVLGMDIKEGVRSPGETRIEDEAEGPVVKMEIEDPVTQRDVDVPTAEEETDEPVVEATAQEIPEKNSVHNSKRDPEGRKGSSPATEDGQGTVADSANIAEISWDQALHGPDVAEWKEAILTEIECLVANDTWNIVDRPNGRNVIGCRTILRNKYRPNGTIDKRKARVVARGFSQRPGVDYHDTFAPVARLSSVRLLMASAVQFDIKVRQLDITTAYLNGKVEEEIYMESPKLLAEFLVEITNRRDKSGAVGRKARKMAQDLRSGDKLVAMVGKYTSEETCEVPIKMTITVKDDEPVSQRAWRLLLLNTEKVNAQIDV
ncbi:hypothetical protein KM043_017538 [Ampulex compressa]|nr:hypothetical protein KM043_017538 [Ampulex compressa]